MLAIGLAGRISHLYGGKRVKNGEGKLRQKVMQHWVSPRGGAMEQFLNPTTPAGSSSVFTGTRCYSVEFARQVGWDIKDPGAFLGIRLFRRHLHASLLNLLLVQGVPLPSTRVPQILSLSDIQTLQIHR